MIEVNNVARTISYGCFKSMKVMKKCIGEMRKVGKVPAGFVLVSHYKNGVLLREYPMTLFARKTTA